MRYLITILTAALLLGCGGINTTDLITKDQSSAIPKKAKKMILTTNLSPDEAYDSVMGHIEEEGIETDWDNKENHAVATEKFPIDGNTVIRMEIHVAEKGSGSTISSTAEWLPRAGDSQGAKVVNAMSSGTRVDTEWDPATWYYPRLNKRGFAGMVEFMVALPHESISYEK